MRMRGRAVSGRGVAPWAGRKRRGVALMMRSILIGVWVCVVSLAGAYGGAYWKSHNNAPQSAAAAPKKLEVKKVKPITVPVIAEGVLKGYVSGEFSYVVEAPDAHGGGGHDAAAKDASVKETADPESYFMDETFRLLYAENKLDFTHIDKIDLVALTQRITARVNERLGGQIIKETLLRNFTFVPKEDLPH
jgi:hypothetical protein